MFNPVSGRALFGACVAIVVLIAAFSIFSLHEYGLYRDRAEERVSDQARTLATTSAVVLTEIDHSLEYIEAVAENALGAPGYEEQVFAALQAARQTTDLPSSFFILDAEGRIATTSADMAPQPYPLGDVDYAAVHIEGNHDGLFIGAARVGRLGSNAGTWIIGLSRAIRAEDGSLAGIIAATVAVDRLAPIVTAHYGSVTGIAAWVRNDGTVVLRTPFAASAILEQTEADRASYAEMLAAQSEGLAEVTSYVDGGHRLVAWYTPDDFPITATVAYAQNDLMFEWERSFWNMLVGILVLCVTLAGLGYLIDLATLRQAQRIRRADDRFEVLLNGIDDIFVATDQHLYLTEANLAARMTLGVTTDLGQRTLFDLFPELSEAEGQRALRQALENGQRTLVQVSRRGVEEVFSVHIYPFFEGLAVLAEIITDRVSMEARLQQSQKMEALGQLTGGIAHDFNNLLTVIIGNAESVLDSPVPAETRQNADEILHAAEQAAELISQLLAFARQQPLMPRSVDLNQQVRNLEPMFRRVLSETIDFVLDLDPTDWRVWVDPNQLESALLNVIINARDAMPDGGVITIETRRLTVDHSELMPGLDLKIGQYVKLSIADSGEGMAADVLDRAFDPFFSTKPQGSGTGLGLSMVYGFVRQSGGQVSLYSEPGIGTTITLYLPRSLDGFSQSVENWRTPISEQEGLTGGAERVLIVEDNPMVRQFAKSCLVELGYQVTDAENAETARALFASGGQFDIVLTDVVLPGEESGPDMVKALWAAGYSFSLLFMSGYPKSALKNMEPFGETEVLGKPFKRAALARAVRSALLRRGH